MLGEKNTPTEIRLKNGLTLICQNMENVGDRADITFVFGVGDCYDGSKPGLAHLAEHMVFGGTKTKSAKEVIKKLDALGPYEAYTSYGQTRFSISVHKNSIGDAVALLVDMFSNASVNEDYFTKEKKVIGHELNLYMDNPDRNLFEIMKKSFGYHNGDRVQKEFLSCLTSEDVKGFISQNYTPNNATLIIAGDLGDPEITEATVRSKTKNWKAVSTEKVALKPLTFKPGVSIEQAPIKSLYFSLFFKGPCITDTQDLIKSWVMNSLIGYGLNSTWMHDARIDSGLTYDIRTIARCEENYGAWGLMSATDRESFPELLKIIVKTLKSLDKLVTNDNLAIARIVLKEGLSKPALTPAQATGDIIFFNELRGMSKENLIKAIDSITVDGMKKWLKDTMASGCSLATYGDFDHNAFTEDMHAYLDLYAST